MKIVVCVLIRYSYNYVISYAPTLRCEQYSLLYYVIIMKFQFSSWNSYYN